MKPIDKLYQNAVDNETEGVLSLSIEDFLKVEDYGVIERLINGKKISIGFWHYRFGDHLHHIFFQAERRAFIFLRKKYLSGAKLDHGIITKLNEKEIGNYD